MIAVFRFWFPIFLFLLHYFNAHSEAEPIMGAVHSAKQTYPFVVLITEKTSMNRDEESLCTGSLISKNQVLTIASRLEDKSLRNLEVFVGSSSPSSTNFHAFNILSKITYKDYEEESKQNGIVMFPQIKDVSILKLDVLDTGINPGVISYELNRPTLGDQVTFVAWGPTRDRLPPRVPRYVNLEVWQKQTCDDYAKSFSPNYRKLLWSNKVFCAQRTHTINAIDGDFGGPVLLEGSKVIGMAIRPRPIPHEIKMIHKQPVLVLRFGIYKDFIQKYLVS